MLFALFRQQNDVGEITTDTRSLFVISDMITVLDICNSRPTFLGKGGGRICMLRAICRFAQFAKCATPFRNRAAQLKISDINLTIILTYNSNLNLNP